MDNFQCVKERHSFERHSWAPLPKLGAKEECHSFLSKGAMWEWHSFFWQGAGAERHSFPPLFFDLYKLAHKAYAYEQVYIFIEKKGKFQCNLNNRFLTGNLSYQIQAFEENLMLNRFFFLLKRAIRRVHSFLKERGRSATPFY